MNRITHLMQYMARTVGGVLPLLPLLAFAQTSSNWQPGHATIMSPWAQLVDPASPLPEYPRPQLERSDWLNLNGIWQFESGAAGDATPTGQTLDGQILVPFPIESALSGVQESFPRSWYRRTFEVPQNWEGQRIQLHLDAVDWESEVFVNGVSLGVHRGGYDRTTYDITPYLNGDGPQELIVRVYDPTDNYGQPRGKQTTSPGGIMYTSASGIWQTVWLEPVPETHIEDLKLVPDVDQSRLQVTANVPAAVEGMEVTVTAWVDGVSVASATGTANTVIDLPITDPHLWSPDDPFLYELQVSLHDGSGEIDSVGSYFGMRKISLGESDGFQKMLLNDEFVFQYGPLDQGYWPDGNYTAPTDLALKADIEQSKILGFNMIRKHIKVEPDRWYYWADKLGIMVWQDMPSANSYTTVSVPVDEPQFESELTTMVENHWNHPSIVSWVVFNEGQGQHNTPELVSMVEDLDPSRLVNEASGWNLYGSGSIKDWHTYPNPGFPVSETQAVVCGEFGGVGLGVEGHTWADGWGYVDAADGDELASIFERMSSHITGFVSDHGLSGAVYTEITDVEIELNGFLTYDRKVRKVDADRIRAAVLGASATRTITDVVPNSRNSGVTWQYSTSQPQASWTQTGFDDSTWNSGPGGFGAGDPYNLEDYTRTTWSTSDIWMRTHFNPGDLAEEEIAELQFTAFFDDNVEIYINGVLAADVDGFLVDYGLLEISPEARAAIIPNGDNVLAVHCQQLSGGQFVDVGLARVQTDLVVPQRPTPTAPQDFVTASGVDGATLGWASSPGATHYLIKRASTPGGPYEDLDFTTPVNAVVDPEVVDGETYYYRVAAANADATSADSEEIAVMVSIPQGPVPELVTWFRADEFSDLADGSELESWTDLSGFGRDAVQANAGRQPSLATSQINGLPVVHFNASESDYLEFESPVSEDFTIYCVFRSNQGIGTGSGYWTGAGLVSGEMPNSVDDFGMSLRADGTLLAGTGRPDVTLTSAKGFNDGQPHIAIFQRTRDTGLIELYVDGVLQDSGTAGRQLLSSPSMLTLGAHPTLENFFTGDIAEVRIFEGVVDEANRSALNSALAYKWGMGPAVAPRVPTNLAISMGDDSTTLTWTPVVEALTYTIERSTSADGPFTTVASDLIGTSFTDPAVSPGSAWFYRITAVSEAGPGSPSAVASVSAPMADLTVVSDTTSVTLSWPVWAADWILEQNDDLDSSWQEVEDAASTVGDRFELTLPIQQNAQFFRLRAPDQD
ncbi:hypothetical protein JIN85_01380 [Luteolibacter pohnpeiensis]|uniref:Fibronectin type-III domain-containing protein n=1 Tax=Luteolibacter pohnpeiensis TaxID=454153 RepID=A0A934VV04_9BACT|nr:sugar-binding domain-containing protein [Luteolibacter pohnpeiensis]MBK1881044.1 hypothetical protein [Luteolibacter pohnpeiensis]